MKKQIPFLMILVFIVVACTAQASSLDGTWILVSYGPPDSLNAAVPGAEATLTFNNDGTVNGSGGCNSLGGAYEVSEETVTFSEVTSTLMACEEPRMEQESAVTRVLSGSAQFEIKDRVLTISNGDTALVFMAGE